MPPAVNLQPHRISIVILKLCRPHGSPHLKNRSAYNGRQQGIPEVGLIPHEVMVSTQDRRGPGCDPLACLSPSVSVNMMMRLYDFSYSLISQAKAHTSEQCFLPEDAISHFCKHPSNWSIWCCILNISYPNVNFHLFYPRSQEGHFGERRLFQVPAQKP